MSAVVFLGIDGVLTSARSHALVRATYNPSPIDPVAVGLVRCMCQAGNAQVVIASTWNAQYRLVREWQTIFSQHEAPLPVLDVLEPDAYQRSPSAAIRHYLNTHAANHHLVLPEFTTSDPFHELRSLRTEPRYGLSLENVIRGLEILREDLVAGETLRSLRALAAQYVSDDP